MVLLNGPLARLPQQKAGSMPSREHALNISGNSILSIREQGDWQFYDHPAQQKTTYRKVHLMKK
ncbi:hypothetical protein HB779_14525 [Phyllobacterium sp. 628]|uniref:hypothetical protein n=1 Tax=Phyllobacterium sp. 628 TaxID=2718938 RepID=UPI0016621CF7|nr:hypothetical protein [Phyllobacterium sp. 628]QND52980.1 hypothetical protein HB779_14525 [Phyllobacterium sp. 628]